ELVKQAKAQAEQSRVALRNIRRDGNEELKKSQKAGEISEDGLSKGEADLQKLTDDYVSKINKAAEAKEKEILEE
ncbi:MAG: ribosome recycling factor, partial [Spirochaetaceae bacterium]|nr:ribosome recycling factor [Spirochaetaceae bacterium]MDR0551038.1 ribosome recycling factor [Spirochaetaceae bacterium]